MSKVWILTNYYNDYDQHGGYFVAAFKTRPEIKELASFFKMDKKHSFTGDAMEALDFLMHVQSGGGRQGTEYCWYKLTEMEYGKRFE